jgi:hypothetical protein
MSIYSFTKSSDENWPIIKYPLYGWKGKTKWKKNKGAFGKSKFNKSKQ